MRGVSLRSTPLPPSLPTGVCCSPLRSSRGRAGAFTTRSACVAPGCRFFPSVGSASVCRLALGAVAPPPTRAGAGSLGLAGRVVRSLWPGRVRHCCRSLARSAFAAARRAFTSRGGTGCAGDRPLTLGVIPYVVPPRRGQLLWATLRGHAGVCRLVAVPATVSARPRVPRQ